MVQRPFIHKRASWLVPYCCIISDLYSAPSAQTFISDARATVSSGLLVILENQGTVRPSPSVFKLGDSSTVPVMDLMQSDAQVAESRSGSGHLLDQIISGASVWSRNSPDSPGSFTPKGVIAVRQDPNKRLTVWLPGQQVQAADAEQGNEILSEAEGDLIMELHPNNSLSNDTALQPPGADPVSVWSTLTNKIPGDASVSGLGLLMVDGWTTPQEQMPGTEIRGQHDARAQRVNLQLLDGWQIPPHHGYMDKEADSSVEKWIEEPNIFTTEVSNNFPAENLLDSLALQRGEHLNGTPRHSVKQEEADLQPMIRSKIKFSKGADGSQSLSYEVVVKQDEGKGSTGKCGLKGVKSNGPKLKGLVSFFMDLLR
ncbi:uncharacterized protein LOC117531926 [Thalassophryne amazonica]|uniref:uncharacterized protein LOC117531926 n=1 Tax=Thalassophryne amazonica TaxID=390379 RepID=UPI001470C1FA|nr:uncharacterized protein LOC117531926 [Thalassophryne amazonica]